MTEQSAATTAESDAAGLLSRSQTVFMVAALLLSVISFMLNATMLSPAIGDINTHLGHNAFASMSSYNYLAGAIANVVLIRWSDYIGRKLVLVGVLVLMCIGTLLCIFGTTLPVVVAGRVLQGASNVTFGLAFLIMRERLTPAVFGVCCGILSAVNGGVAGSDALLGGYLVDHFGYRSIFVLTLAVGIPSVALAWKAVPDDESAQAAPGPNGLGGGGPDRGNRRGDNSVHRQRGRPGLEFTVRARLHRRCHRRFRGIRRGREARGATAGPHR